MTDPIRRASVSASRNFTATIAALARPADLRRLSLRGVQLVMAMRMCALFEAAGRDPMLEMTTRFRSVTAARSVLELSEAVRQCWPESFLVYRPCCLALSPDENTLAAMIHAVCAVDGEAFRETLNGLIRSDRMDRLHDMTVRAVAALEAANGEG